MPGGTQDPPTTSTGTGTPVLAVGPSGGDASSDQATPGGHTGRGQETGRPGRRVQGGRPG
ncbi:hypothetical protein [Streptomyces sp. NBC_00439]|uniref:hypothetical protein n=1 Tax=Streptomyces sp. NBC_00439 TaxID=2903650 RepID=UPI00225708FB|nr:hypothetical protein [Streptomyces sp. NBC_00439]MCX5100245.1 hypothetical protein [Streptomyces sp. NBC_00439]